MSQIEQYLELAIEAAREAGDYAYNTRKGDLQITTKSTETDLVTQIDTRNEQEIRRRVLERYPNHSFLGEETGASVNRGGVRWIVDPIDGTVNFAHGMPIWCVSIGVEVDGVVECGAIYNPNMNELFSTVRGGGAYLNGRKLSVSGATDPKRSLYVTGFPYNVGEDPDRVIEQFVAFLSRGLLVRRLGSAALDLAYVAAGRFDAFWEAYLSPWDTAAGVLMVTEAGGRVTHYDGSEFDIYKKSIIASNGAQHDYILDIITTTRNASR